VAGFEHMTQKTDRWENNIKMDLKEIRYECLYWIHVAHDRISGGNMLYMN
jgi:hypothetical protein